VPHIPASVDGYGVAVRVLIVDTYYEPFLREHYRDRPGLGDEGYHVQLMELMARSFGTSDAYSHNLRLIGHDAAEVVANCVPLQRRWAEEHGVRTLGAGLMGLLERGGRVAARLSGLLHRIVLAQVEAFRPDVVYLQDIGFHTTRQLHELAGRDRLLVGQIASKPPSVERLRAFALITTSFPHFVERFRRTGLNAEELRIAFDERILSRLTLAAPPPRNDVVFVGGVDRRVHAEGVRLLEHVATHLDGALAVYGYGASTWAKGSPLHACYRGEAWGLEMYRVYAGARVVLNRHIAAAEGWSNNMRLYEATGAGAALLTDRGRNLGELFEVGTEVSAYADEAELVSLAGELLANERARARLANAGQQRTLREHTYRDRMAELAAMLEERLDAPATRSLTRRTVRR
jgi:hypothetical protein